MRKHKNEAFQAGVFPESSRQLNNPGCGWYQIYSFDVSFAPNTEELVFCMAQEESLALLLLDIGAFREQQLSAKALSHVEMLLRFFSERNKELILRITYDRVGKGLEREPDTLEMVECHMEQLGRLIVKYQKSIFLLQGVFVGNWGEMHGSKFLSEDRLKRLFATLWRVTEGTCYLTVRRPAQWEMLFGNGAQALQSQRTGLFNDGMFGSVTDLGTYGMEEKSSEGAENRKWGIAAVSLRSEKVPYGGEAVGITSYSDLRFAVAEMRQTQVSYLNRIHDAATLEKWRQSKWERPKRTNRDKDLSKCKDLSKDIDLYEGMNGYDYIGRHLGYRFVVREVRLERKKKLLLAVIENVGFACLYEEADCYLKIRMECKELQAERTRNDKLPKSEHRRETELFEMEQKLETELPEMEQKLDADPRTWKSGSVTELRLPLGELPPGTCQLFLQLRRKKDGRPLQFANEGADDSVYLGCMSF